MNLEFHTPALTVLFNVLPLCIAFPLSNCSLFSHFSSNRLFYSKSLSSPLPPSIAPVPAMFSDIISQPNIRCVPFQRDTPANTADYQENILGRRLKVGNSYLLSSWADGRFWFCRSAWECPRFNWFLSVLSVCFFAFVSYMCYLQHP